MQPPLATKRTYDKHPQKHHITPRKKNRHTLHQAKKIATPYPTKVPQKKIPQHTQRHSLPTQQKPPTKINPEWAYCPLGIL